MLGTQDVVITGIGCSSPLGLGRTATLQSLNACQSAVGPIFESVGENGQPNLSFYGARVNDFDAKQYVRPRKALKVMSREVQLAYVASQFAVEDAALDVETLDSERVGVVYGCEMIPGDHSDLIPAIEALREDGEVKQQKWGSTFERNIFPLWMLKNLPNMPACHVGIAIDARGPNNTIAQEEVSGLLALSEAVAIIERGQADVMLVGAMGSRVTPTRLAYRLRELYAQGELDANQPGIGVPFNEGHCGIATSEAAVTLVLETRAHAMKREANILASIVGIASRCGPLNSRYAGSSSALSSACVGALSAADLAVDEINHVSAQGFSSPRLDQTEAAAIKEFAPDVPVTAYSSFHGFPGAAGDLLGLSMDLLASTQKTVFPVLGFSKPADGCDLNIVSEKSPLQKRHFVKTSFSPYGHAAAAVVQCEG